MRVKNSNHSALNRELTPRTARASRLIADGMCPLRNTHNLRVPPLGWVSPAASASAPLGLSAHPYEPAHRPARALSWLTCHSARHRRAPRLQPGAAIVTTLNRPGFAHHTLPLWRALCSSSSSPGRSTPPSRRTIPCSSYIMAIRSLGSFVAPRPHMARPPPADSARGRRRGRLHARWTCVILGRLHRALVARALRGQCPRGARARPAPRAKRPRVQRGEKREAGSRRATLSGAAAAANAPISPPEAAVQHSAAARAR